MPGAIIHAPLRINCIKKTGNYTGPTQIKDMFDEVKLVIVPQIKSADIQMIFDLEPAMIPMEEKAKMVAGKLL